MASGFAPAGWLAAWATTVAAPAGTTEVAVLVGCLASVAVLVAVLVGWGSAVAVLTAVVAAGCAVAVLEAEAALVGGGAAQPGWAVGCQAGPGVAACPPKGIRGTLPV